MFDNVRLLTTNSSSELFEQMVRIGENDVIIGISFPRYSMRTLKALEFANNRSAKVITITDSIHSPMNLYSSCNLIADSDMASIVDSLLHRFQCINALIVALCMKKQKEVGKTLRCWRISGMSIRCMKMMRSIILMTPLRYIWKKTNRRTDNLMSKVIVIGGGPAGMFAAIAAAETRTSGNVVMKKMKSLGKKLYITGKGDAILPMPVIWKCSFKCVRTTAKFLYSAFYAYDNQQVIDFFERMVCRQN